MTRRLLCPTTALLATLAANACNRLPPGTDDQRPTPKDGIELSSRSAELAGIETATVAASAASDTLDAVGTLALDDTRTARIGALVEGVVSATHVSVGDRVGPHATLAGLHSHELHDGWANYRKAVADRRRVAQDAAYAQDALARTERLLADKAAAPLEVDRARAARVAADEQVTMADAEVRRTQESLEHLGIAATTNPQARTTEIVPVRTPQPGVVLEKLVTTGTAVTPGTPLFVVSDTRFLWAVAEIDEAMLTRVRTGAPVSIWVSAYGDEVFPATVAHIGDTINPTTRRVVVRCRVANADLRLKPGMFARLSLAGAAGAPVIRVPVDAVQDVGDRRVVFVADGQRRYARRDVDVGTERDGTIEVRHGLTPGERIVVRGAFLLKSQLLASPEP
ncbi:MAG TPA: efflux RND transporter periplasmic adaptor subunit [Luteitalea sp.]|nr:efflux RND transporter periplasmic adaptor subunit [Luteitalea sp.]